MTTLDFLSLTPLLIIASAPIIIMLTIIVSRNLKIIYGFSLIAFVTAFLSLFFVKSVAPHKIDPLFIIDGYGILFLGIIYLASFLITILSFIYLKQHGGEKEEYFIVLFVAVLGASVLVIANHFVTFFLGIETLSVSLFILIPYLRSRDNCIEAGVKYLVMASVASAFLLFGMGLIFTATGYLNFNEIADSLGTSGILSPIILAGIGMLIVGIGFKLALVPFHMWTPDVYQGTMTPVTTFIATISKGAVLAVILRFFFDIHGFSINVFVIVISIIAVLSMFTGNLLAIRQSNLKRLFAYSSIAHMGYLMITLLIGSENGIQAAIFYIVAYIITTLGAFGVISLLSSATFDAEDIQYYRGLFWKNPWIAIVLSLTMLSLAGIPLTAGFMAKFYLAFEGIKSGLWLLVISLIINSVISLYYYLRVITMMFSASDNKTLTVIPFMGNVVLALIVFGIIFLGILPSGLFEMIASVPGLK